MGVSLVLSSVALLITLGSLIVLMLQRNELRRQASEAKRANDRLDALDAEQRRRARVRWIVEAHGTSSFVLRNEGLETARSVAASTDSGVITSGPLTDVPGRGMVLFAASVAPGGGIRFSCEFNHFVGVGRELQVVWEGQVEPVSVPIPASPPAPPHAPKPLP